MPSNTEKINVRQKPPAFFEFVRRWVEADRRGGYRLIKVLDVLHQRFPLLNEAAWFSLNDGSRIAMPLDWPQLLAKGRLDAYEATQVETLTQLVEQSKLTWTLVDCGADVGLFTRLLLMRTPHIRRVVALEPNPRSFSLLEMNLPSSEIEVRCLNVAVSNFVGEARLVQPSYYKFDHAKHIVRGDGGGVSVLTIDSLRLPTDLAVLIKIDVEGEELSTLQGAIKTLTTASSIIVQVEANREVARRTGIDPSALVKYVQSIRPVQCFVVHDRSKLGKTVDPDRRFFDQYSEHNSCDIIMTSL